MTQSRDLPSYSILAYRLLLISPRCQSRLASVTGIELFPEFTRPVCHVKRRCLGLHE